jgi:cellulose synthase/poly-beta-1,6-N-acetylglucosamine synthase-like glycosyltransferase
MDLVIIILLCIISLVLIWQFVGYPLFMAVLALYYNKNELKDYTYQPYISIVVPTYNEESAIGKRIYNLFELNYPKDRYEIIVVDSGSNDGTADIVKKIHAENSSNNVPLKLVVENERRGKASAINLGKRYANGDIVLVTDANCLFNLDVLREIGPHFNDPKVGAVGGRYVVLTPSNAITLSEEYRWDIEYLMLRGESVLDSAAFFHGEINAWRKDLVDADVRMLSEDLDMCVSIRKKGYRVIYEPGAVVYELAPATSIDQFKKRKRTGIGTIQNIFKHITYFLPPKDLYALIIFPSHKTIPMLSPFLFLAVAILYLLAWNISIIAIHFLLTLLIFIILLIILMSVKSMLIENRSPKQHLSLLFIPRVVYYVLLNEYIILSAWLGYFFGSYSVLWDKVESTRNEAC